MTYANNDKPLSNKLARIEMEMLQQFISTIEHFDKNDDASEFTTIVAMAVEKNWVSQAELADEFCANRGTISRWISGKTFPHVAYRPVIIKWIIDACKYRLTRLQNSFQQSQLIDMNHGESTTSSIMLCDSCPHATRLQ